MSKFGREALLLASPNKSASSSASAAWLSGFVVAQDLAKVTVDRDVVVDQQDAMHEHRRPSHEVIPCKRRRGGRARQGRPQRSRGMWYPYRRLGHSFARGYRRIARKTEGRFTLGGRYVA